MTTKKTVKKVAKSVVATPVEEKKDTIQISPQEVALLNQKRREKELATQCANEISAVLKKYGMHLETTKPEVVIIPNQNA